MATSSCPPRHILLTGVPGIGKTTLMKKLQQELIKKGIQSTGFITEEVRSGGRRIGFDVVTLDGQRGHLARISNARDDPSVNQRSNYMVGQYSVNMHSFEQTALPQLHLKVSKSLPSGEKPCCQVYIVDEIGKMELFSKNFIQAVKQLVKQPNLTMVATIPVPKGRPLPLVEELRSGAFSHVFEVSRQNRDTILDDILVAVESSVTFQRGS